MRLLVIAFAWLATCLPAVAQNFSIVKIERTGGSVILHYSLADTVSRRTYTINVYSSNDDFTNPLTKVSGDVGLEVSPGPNRKIVWDAVAELGSDFSGDVALEVRGKVFVPFIRLDGFDEYKKFKRNKVYNITWTGGRGNNVLNFDLYHGERKVTTYPNIANVGHYSLRFSKVKSGKNYRLKVTDSKNKDDVVYSEPFRIKAKVPLLVKVLPLIGVGYLITTLGGEKGLPEIGDPVEPE